MTARKLTKLELRIMDALWSIGPASVREVQETFPERERPAYTTIQTTMYRLEGKGTIRRIKKISNAHIFEAVVSRTAAHRRLIDDLLSVFGGRTQPVMAHLIEAGKLTIDGKGALQMSLLMHLWQSTLCAGIAALLAAAFTRASARTRYGIWLVASLKFLVPLSLLVAAGSYAGQWLSPMATPTVSVAFRWLDQSLSIWTLETANTAVARFPLAIDRIGLLALALVWASGALALTTWRWTQWHAVATLARSAARLEEGREAEALRRLAAASPRARHIALLQCASNIEPGVLGIFRPKLLWPAGLSDRLTDRELDAVLAHEISHVERRDTLTATIHMLVETAFWFHPIVWWIGARLVSERERACDEEVVRMGTDTRSYAAGILKVCGFCLRAPVAFVAGVGGSRLTHRIERILKRPTPASLTLPARLLLAGVLFATIGAPLAAGVSNAHRDTASILAPPPRPINSSTAARQSEQNERQVYRPGNGVTQPKLLHEVKPVYTLEAKQAGIQGVVWLEAVVLDTGLVEEVTITHSLDTEYGLDDEAVKALKQWRFAPGTKDNKPVSVRVEVEMSFRLK
jgi:TonB family protein